MVVPLYLLYDKCEQQGSKRSFYEHHYTWFILEQILSRSVRIFLLSVISRYEKSDKSIVWWFQSNRRSSKVISVLIWIYIFRPKWQSPRILRIIIRFHISRLLCLVSLYICIQKAPQRAQPSGCAERKSTRLELSLFWSAIGWNLAASIDQPIAGQNRLSSKCVDFYSAQVIGCGSSASQARQEPGAA